MEPHDRLLPLEGSSRAKLFDYLDQDDDYEWQPGAETKLFDPEPFFSRDPDDPALANWPASFEELEESSEWEGVLSWEEPKEFGADDEITGIPFHLWGKRGPGPSN